MLILWEKVLTATARTQTLLQASKMSLDRMCHALKYCRDRLTELSYEQIELSARPIAVSCGIDPKLTKHTVFGLFRFYSMRVCGGLGLMLADDLEAKMKSVFDSIINAAIDQLDKRFKGQQMVTSSFWCIQLENLVQSSDEDLEDSARKLQKLYTKDIGGSSLSSDLIHFRKDYTDTLSELNSAKGIVC